MGDPHHTGLRGYLHLLGKWSFWIPFTVEERDSGFVKSVPALFYVYMSVLSACASTRQKRAADPVIDCVSHQVVAGN